MPLFVHFCRWRPPELKFGISTDPVLARRLKRLPAEDAADVGRGDDSVGKPSSSSHLSIRVFRAQFSLLELFELVLLLKLDQQFPVEQFEATVSRSTVSSPPLLRRRLRRALTRRGVARARCPQRCSSPGLRSRTSLLILEGTKGVPRRAG